MENNDYKHMIEDFSNVFLGGRLSYKEIMENEDIPFKLRAIFMHYMLPGISDETTLENHLFFIEKNSLSYMTYKKLKAKFILNVFYKEGMGKIKPGYHISEYEIDEVLNNDYIMENKDVIFLQEVRIKKLKIMSVTV